MATSSSSNSSLNSPREKVRSTVPKLVDLTDKVVSITGAGAGIGAATALTLAQTGAQVIAAVKPGTGSDLEAENKGGRITPLPRFNRWCGTP